MSEPRYLIIKYIRSGGIYQDKTITESELLNRFKAAMYWAEQGYPLSKSLDILVNGEKREG